MLEQATLSDFRCFAEWTKAPDLALLQVRLADGHQAIGWRCNYENVKCLLIVEPWSGLLLADHTIGLPTGAAIDMSATHELVLVEPAITEKVGDLPVVGSDGAVFVRATNSILTELNEALICVAGADTIYATGSVYPRDQIGALYGIAPRIGVQWNEGKLS